MLLPEDDRHRLQPPVPKVPLGELVVTPRAFQALNWEDIWYGTTRHMHGEWGDLDAAGRQENDRAVLLRCRVRSVYRSILGVRFWVVTNADRGKTTVLLPDEAHLLGEPE